MSQSPEGDDFKTKGLADYSDAIARGENPDPRGIDPIDADLIRELHSLRRDMNPDPQLTSRLRSALADHIAAEEANSRGQQTDSDRATNPFPPSPIATVSGQSDSRYRVESPSTAPQTPPAPPPAEPRPFWRAADEPTGGGSWRPSLAAIAASLILFVAAAGGLFYLATNRDQDEPTVPAAALSTETPSSTATNVENVIPGETASPSVRTSEGFLIFSPFREESSVGDETPVSESFRSTTVVVPWDGTGMVILSGCSDRPCGLLLDDELHLQVTNSEGKGPRIFADDNGSENGNARALPIVLTDLFREGDNSVTVALWDKEGNRRGLMTPVYIVILR